MMNSYLKIYLMIWAIMSFITLLLYVIDKIKAMSNKWRIKESVLLICTFLLGSIGAFIGMNFFHHKTRYWYFRAVCVVSLIIHTVVAILIQLSK